MIYKEKSFFLLFSKYSRPFLFYSNPFLKSLLSLLVAIHNKENSFSFLFTSSPTRLLLPAGPTPFRWPSLSTGSSQPYLSHAPHVWTHAICSLLPRHRWKTPLLPRTPSSCACPCAWARSSAAGKRSHGRRCFPSNARLHHLCTRAASPLPFEIENCRPVPVAAPCLRCPDASGGPHRTVPVPRDADERLDRADAPAPVPFLLCFFCTVAAALLSPLDAKPPLPLRGVGHGEPATLIAPRFVSGRSREPRLDRADGVPTLPIVKPLSHATCSTPRISTVCPSGTSSDDHRRP